MRIFLIFTAGFILDVLATLDMQAVIKKQYIKSFFYSFTLTVLSCGVLANIIVNQNIWIEIMAYALGGAIGSLLTIRFSK